MFGGKTRDKNGRIRNKISKHIGIHYHEEETPDSLIGQRKCILIRFDVNKEMLSRIILFYLYQKDVECQVCG